MCADADGDQGNDTRVAGVVGIGLEYRLADSIGVGGEVRYLASRGHEIEIEGTRQRSCS